MPLLAAVHLTGTYAASPVAAEVQSDASSAYCAHAAARFRAYGSSPMLNAVNPLYLGLFVVAYFYLGCYSLVSRRGLRFSPWLSLTNEVTKYHRGPGWNRRSANFKKTSKNLLSNNMY